MIDEMNWDCKFEIKKYNRPLESPSQRELLRHSNGDIHELFQLYNREQKNLKNSMLWLESMGDYFRDNFARSMKPNTHIAFRSGDLIVLVWRNKTDFYVIPHPPVNKKLKEKESLYEVNIDFNSEAGISCTANGFVRGYKKKDISKGIKNILNHHALALGKSIDVLNVSKRKIKLSKFPY